MGGGPAQFWRRSYQKNIDKVNVSPTPHCSVVWSLLHVASRGGATQKGSSYKRAVWGSI